MPLVSIVTPSFNKHEYIMDAVESVLNQTLRNFEYWIIDNSTDFKTRKLLNKHLPKDPRIHYLEFDFSTEERKSLYPTAYILNQIYPELRGKYISYLSDDDLLYPKCFEKMVNFLETHPDKHIAYHSLEIVANQKGKWVYHSQIPVGHPRGKGTKHLKVDYVLDGGQIMHRTSCLQKIKPPYFPENLQSANHCDGIFLSKLAQHFTFYPYPTSEYLSTHRITPKSNWVK